MGHPVLSLSELMNRKFSSSMIFSNRESRDICRKLLGGPENVTFLVMNLTKDCQKKRLAHRHGDDSDGFAEMLSKE